MANLVWFDATVSLGFPCHIPEHVSPTESKPIVLYICNSFYNQKPLTDQFTTKSYKIYLSYHFSVKTHYNITLQKLGTITNFVRLIPKSNLQCQYFTNTVTQYQNTIQAWFFFQDSNWVVYSEEYGIQQYVIGLTCLVKKLLKIHKLTFRII